MKLNLVNIITGAVLLIVGSITLLQIRGLEFMDGTGPGPSFLPFFLGVFLIILALLLLSGKPLLTFTNNEANLKQTLGYIILFALTVFLLPYIGTSLAILFFIFIELVIIEKRKVFVSLMVSVGTSVSVFLIFEQLFGLPLPHGFLGI